MSNVKLSKAERLDQRVVSELPELSRAFAATLIAEGKVQVNGEVNVRPGHKMKAGDRIKVDFDLESLKVIPHIDLPINYEDDDVIVIDKPAGMLTHSKGAFNPEATVATWLREYLVFSGKRLQKSKSQNVKEETGVTNQRAGIVHRLDRATSGVMIVAKTPEALSYLQKQFSQRKVKKAYVALIEGSLEPAEAIIDMPIARNPKQPATFRVDAQGKSAITHYKVIEAGPTYSLIELKPETGRTHQLRVHLKHLGHPIVGDTVYAGAAAERLFLHAKSLEITLPSRERRVFESQVPKAFKQKAGSTT